MRSSQCEIVGMRGAGTSTWKCLGRQLDLSKEVLAVFVPFMYKSIIYKYKRS